MIASGGFPTAHYSPLTTHSSFIPQRAHRIQQRRPQCRQHAEQYRDADRAKVHQRHTERLDVCGYLVEIVDLAAEDLDASEPRQALLDLIDVDSDEDADRGAQGDAHRA